MLDPIRVEELFFAAIELNTPEERAAYLDDACRDEPELRQRVDLLVEGHFKTHGFLDSLSAASAAPDDLSPRPISENGHENGNANDRTREHVRVPTETIGSRIGPYKLLQQLGEGGTVYMAEQEHPVKRRVALKIIKTGMDSAQVTARFEQERQALAMMDHPNIAKVLDAGATETGRPYFVMELVKGIPITRFCDQEHLSPQERLELFMPVCQAVQHAHQKGIIHRDLKPSNVLIALYDGKAVPKVIDFGVAKATHQRLTERTMFTEVGSIVGTLEYMAPEQAELNNLDIDTRADIYSLGVLLYELLTGSPPFSAKQLRGAAFTEMLRMIREVEPPKPSTRLSSSDELPSIAANRKLEPRRLTSLVTGELDWIVMKALEKDRGRRYETANGLAMDIGRYLSDEPVLASPPSAAYRMKKFVRRNKGPVAAAVGLLLALSAGVVGTTIGLVRAENARQAEAEQRKIAQTKEREALAERAKALEAAEQERLAKEREAAQRRLADEQRRMAEEQKERAEANEKQALAEKQIAEAVRTFLQQDLLRQADATEQANALRPLGGAFEAKENPTIKELLERAAAELTPEKIEARFHGQSELQASILQTVGTTFRGVGEYDKAVEFMSRSSDIYCDAFGPDHPRTLNALSNLATAYRVAGNTAQAIELFERVRDAQVTQLGNDHPSTLATICNLATAYRRSGKLPQAIELLEQVRDARVVQLGVDHPSTLTALNMLAAVYVVAGRLPQGIELLEQVREARVAQFGADHPDTVATLNDLAWAYRTIGKFPEAIELFEQARVALVKRRGADHPHTLNTLGSLAAVYVLAQKLPQAIELFEQVRDAQIKKLGADHPDTLTTLNNLAGAYFGTGKLVQALELLEQVRDAKVKQLGADHPSTLATLNNLAAVYHAAGKLPQAIELFERVREDQVRKLGVDHPDALTTLCSLAMAYQDAENLHEAKPLFLRAAEGIEKRKFQHEQAGRIVNNLIGHHEKLNEYAEAETWRQKWLAVVKERAGVESPAYAGELALLGANLLKQNKWTDAEPVLRDCLTLREKLSAGANPQVLPWPIANTKSMLGESLAGQEKHAEAEPLLLAGYEELKEHEATIPPEGKVCLTEALQRLVDFYVATGQAEKADEWHAKLEAAEPKVPGPDR